MNKKYPFKFLDSYTKDDKDIFFGREEETEQLFQMLTQSDIVLVYGASGTGKTSLIQCGLSKKIDDYDWMPFYIRRGTNLNTAIKNSLQKYVPDYKVSVSDFLDELFDDQATGQAAESEVVELLRKVYMSHFKPLYLIFDQFEELFILGNKQEQKDFLKTIKEILNVELPIKLIFSIREEYLGHLYDFEKEVPELMRKKIRVEAMHREKVQEIIKGVTEYEQSNIRIAKNEVENFTLKVFEKIKGKKELTIQLPYLQVFLDKLYLHITNDNKRQQDALFTISELEKLGNIDDVLSEFLEEQVSEIQTKLNPDFPKMETKHLWEILSKFASLEGTKEPLSKQQLYDRLPKVETKLIDKLIFELTNRSILRYIESEEVYELMHDALAQRVAEKRSEDEIALLQAAQLIKSQTNLKPEARSYFISKQLALIEPFIEKLKLSQEEKDFIAQSEKEAEKQRMEKVNRQRKIIAGVTVALIVAIVLSILALLSRTEAKKQQKIAIKAKIEAENQKTIAIQKQKEADSLYRQITITNYKKYYEKAMDLAKEKNYVEAIEQLKIAKDFATDTNSTKVDNKINEFKQVAGKEAEHNELMRKAKNLERTEANWLEAIKVYEEAYNLGFDKITAQNRINSLENRIKQKLKDYKDYIQRFEKGDKQSCLQKCKNALLICTPNKNKNEYNYFTHKKNQLKNTNK